MAASISTMDLQSPGAEDAGVSIALRTKKATETRLPSHFLFYFDLLLTFQRTGGWELFAQPSLQAVLSSVPQLPEGASCPGFIFFCSILASA